MIFIAILFISVLSFLVDWYIYRRIVRHHILGHVWRKAYLWYAISIDLLIVVALLLYKSAIASPNATLLHAVMWIIGLFFINAVPKFIYTTISLADYIVKVFTHRSSHLFGYLGTMAAIAGLCVMIWGTTLGRTQIEVRKVDIASQRLPKVFDGLRIVQVSDLHIGSLIAPERTLQRMVDTINSLRADIVVVSGDLVNIHSDELSRPIIDQLSRIHSRMGVFSVLGNHDLGFYIPNKIYHTPQKSVERILDVQQTMGWHTLSNQSQFIKVDGDSIAVSGVNFPLEFRHNGHTSHMTGIDLGQTFDNVPDSLYNIVISHAPQLWANILETGHGDLTLAGHVHSMQMKLRIGNWMWSPARFMYKWWSGLYSQGDRHLYINDGIGYVIYPMRIGTRPEVTLIELHAL